MKNRVDVLLRFMDKVNKTDTCWLWTGSMTKGYGKMGVDGHTVSASKIAYELFVGPVPNESDVLHECDVPACVNPEHLFLGTQQDNSDDMIRKGRDKRGIHPGKLNGRAKLSEQDVADIRSSAESGVALAAQYNVSSQTISAIRSGKLWRHI